MPETTSDNRWRELTLRNIAMEAELERVQHFLRRFHMADNRNAGQIARLQDEALSFLSETRT